MRIKPKMKALKYVVVGDSGVGKTSLLNRFTDGKFETETISTIGVDFKSKTVNRLDYIDQAIISEEESSAGASKLTLNIWDTAGQQRYNTITRSFYRGAHAIILLFAVNDRSSFANVSKWINKIIDQGGHQFQRIVYLVGSKADEDRISLANVTNRNNSSNLQEMKKNRQDQREISQEEANCLAQKHGVPYIQISSKTGFNVEQLFKNVTNLVVQSHENILEDRASQKIILPAKLIKKTAKNKCC